MKTVSFVSSIFIAGALFVSAGAQAQESPYQFWGLQGDSTAEAATSTDDAIPFQIRRRSEDQPETSIGEPLAWRKDYYVTPTQHAISGAGYGTRFSTRQ